MKLEVAPGLFIEDPSEEFLAKHKARIDANPLVGYFPFPHQKEFHEAIGRKTPIVAMFAGNRAGKTECSIIDDLIQALPAEWVPDHLKPYKRWDPPFHGWIAVQKYAKLEDATFPKIRKFCPKSQLYGGSFDKAYSKQDKFLRFANGSTLAFKTFDQDVDAFASAALHRVHWDEEPEGEHGRAIRQEARIRLIDYGGDELLSMTPLLGLSWVYEEIWEKRTEPHICVVRASMDDNPTLDEESKALALADATAEELKARRSGEFVHFRGLVYADFKDEKHVVDPPKVAHVKGLDTVIGIDPGIRTTAVVFCGFDNDNSMLVYDELYLHDQDAIPEHAAEHIKAKIKAWGIDPMYTVIDPSARNRNLATGINVEDAYLRAGLPTLHGQHQVEAGVFEVKRRLQHDPPLFHVSKDCRTFIWEIGRYRMDDRADGVFKVVKENDHLMDGFRYVAMSRPMGPSGPATGAPEYHWEPGMAPPAEWGNQFHEPPSPLGIT